MKLTFVWLVSTLFAAVVFADTPIAGDWLGRVELSSKAMLLRLHLEGNNTALSGSLTMPAQQIANQPLSSVRFESGALHFEMKMPDQTWTFDGKVGEAVLSGTLSAKEITGDVDLTRIATVSSSVYSKYFGIYQLDSNQFIYIRTWDELGENTLTYFRNSGQIGALYPVSETQYFSGPSLLVPSPRSVTVRFGKKSGEAGLWLSNDGQKEEYARKIQPYTEEEVRFQNGQVTLGGTLLVPTTSGIHPAIVLVHGSSSVTRDFFGPIAYDFVRKGIAVLSYDKRGVGVSTGHWMDSDYQDLAADALAAVQLLTRRKEVDPSRIGLFGISQGGWIGPLAASQSKDVGFLVLISAPGVTPENQIIASQEAELQTARVDEKDIADTSAKTRSQLDWLKSAEASTQLQEDLKKLQQQKSDALTQRSLENPRYLLWLRRVLEYDPLPPLRKTACPVLLIYGDLDRTVPFKENLELVQQGLKDGGNQRVDTRVFPNANHALIKATTGASTEFPYLKEFVPGFFDSITDWILKLPAK